MKNSPPPSSRTRHSPRSKSPERFPRSSDGFTLVEIAVVVMIIGILSTMALPASRKAGSMTRINTYVNDLRVFSGGFNQFAQMHGKWPATQTSSQSFPEDMEGHLSETSWTRVTPLGGSYTWDHDVLLNGRTITAAISLVASPERPVSATNEQLLEIDTKIDDGNLATGMFQLGFGDMPIYIIEGDSAPGAAAPPAPAPAAGSGAFEGWFSGSLLLLAMARFLGRKERNS